MDEFESKEVAAQLATLPLPTSVEEADLQKEQLLAWKVQIEEDRRRIKAQITSAKSEAYHGQYSDPGWWRRANDALSIKHGQVQRIQDQLTKLKRLRQTMAHEQHVQRRLAKGVLKLGPEERDALLESLKLKLGLDFVESGDVLVAYRDERARIRELEARESRQWACWEDIAKRYVIGSAAQFAIETHDLDALCKAVGLKEVTQ